MEQRKITQLPGAADETIYKLNQFSAAVNLSSCKEDIDNCIRDLSSVIDGVASPLFKHNLTSLPSHGNESYDYKNKWYTSECDEKRRLFYTALNMYRQDKTELNRINMINKRSEYKQCIRRARFDYDRAETQKLLSAREKNAKLYWKMLKGSCGIKDPNISLDSFESYFKAVNSPEDRFYTPDHDVLYFMERYEKNEFNIMFEELNLPFTHDELLKSIKHLNSDKSGGPDMYLNEFFIHGKNVLSSHLLKLFNKIFEIGYFPEAWSEGFVVPLHKKGSINEVNNYRGITLLSTLGKLFTRVLNNRLCEWAEMYSVYIESQAGFRSEMGTADNIFVLHGLVSHMINNNKQLHCAFIDFSKAFDYVTRDNLWMKLIKLGIRGKILQIIRSIYENVKSRVKYMNQLSNSFECRLGVRQGECLSPFLFSMFLNDIENIYVENGVEGIDVYMFKMFLILYADDIVIFANNSEELQANLDLLYNYCNRWKLSVNSNKTKVMIFRKGGRLPNNIIFHYGGEQLEIVNKFVYLGIVFSTGGSFSDTQNTLAGQASKAIFKLNKYLHRFTNIRIKHKLDLFDKLVLPILNYGCETWGFHSGSSLERVHLQFCKRLLGVKRTTQNDFIYGELGRMPLQNHRYFIIIKFWIKILHSDPKKYIKIIYNIISRHP